MLDLCRDDVFSALRNHGDLKFPLKHVAIECPYFLLLWKQASPVGVINGFMLVYITHNLFFMSNIVSSEKGETSFNFL